MYRVTVAGGLRGRVMPMRLIAGKVPWDLLQKLVFPFTGVPNKNVLVGPAVGEDAAAIALNGDLVLIFSSDPITGAIRNAGWLCVHVNANDVASMGARPRWMVLTVLLPENSSENLLAEIMKGADKACRNLGVSIVGGHSEVTPGLKAPILMGSMLGTTTKDKLTTSSGAKPGDLIVMTKTAGVEGTAILASDLYDFLAKSLDREILERAKEFIKRISVVEEALAAIETGGVTAAHDVTEGGFSGALHELADASGVGFIVDEGKIPLAEETKLICKVLGVDPLSLIGSGSLLLTVKPEMIDKVLNAILGVGVKPSVVGKIVKEERLIRRKDGRVEVLKRPLRDELWRVLERYGGGSW